MKLCTCEFNEKQLESNVVSLVSSVLQLYIFPKVMYSLGVPTVSDKYSGVKYFSHIFFIIMIIFSIINIYYDINFIIKSRNENIKIQNSYCMGESLTKTKSTDCSDVKKQNEIINYVTLFNNSGTFIISILLFFGFIFSKNKNKWSIAFYCILLSVASIFSLYTKSGVINKLFK